MTNKFLQLWTIYLRRNSSDCLMEYAPKSIEALRIDARIALVELRSWYLRVDGSIESIQSYK